jgi:hypothetical protein
LGTRLVSTFLEGGASERAIRIFKSPWNALKRRELAGVIVVSWEAVKGRKVATVVILKVVRLPGRCAGGQEMRSERSGAVWAG